MPFIKYLFITSSFLLLGLVPTFVLADYTQYFTSGSKVDDKIDDLDNDPVDLIKSPVLLGSDFDNVRSDYGDSRGGGTRSHEGQDFVAPKGSPVVSPTDAVVLRVTDGSNSGLVVYTANPGDEVFVYMHLDWVADIDRGDRLQKGDLIGLVGNTGNAINAGDHLHFEIRQQSGPVDPYPRIEGDFSNKTKAKYLNRWFSDLDQYYQEVLINNYGDEFRSWHQSGYELPDEILTELNLDSTNQSRDNNNNDSGLDIKKIVARYLQYGQGMSFSDLSVGNTGSSVVWLQEFLIRKDAGPEARYLSRTGSTGYYGSITKNAISEYQSANSLPATGLYNQTTRAYILLFGL